MAHLRRIVSVVLGGEQVLGGEHLDATRLERLRDDVEATGIR